MRTLVIHIIEVICMQEYPVLPCWQQTKSLENRLRSSLILQKNQFFYLQTRRCTLQVRGRLSRFFFCIVLFSSEVEFRLPF